MYSEKSSRWAAVFGLAGAGSPQFGQNLAPPAKDYRHFWQFMILLPHKMAAKDLRRFAVEAYSSSSVIPLRVMML